MLIRTAAVLIVWIGSFSMLCAQDPSAIANEKTGNITFREAPFVGLWEVLEVTAGDEVVTPVAKWFDIRPDGISIAGNGGIQNAYGSWKYDAQQHRLLFSNRGKVDEGGPFDLSFREGKMVWERPEEGMTVKVTLARVTEKPRGPWDKIVGIWKSDEEKPEYFFMRWDRRYVRIDDGNRSVGIWHIEAHSPGLTLFDDAGGSRQQWTLTFEDDRMIWISPGESPEVRKVFRKVDRIGQ